MDDKYPAPVLRLVLDNLPAGFDVLRAGAAAEGHCLSNGLLPTGKFRFGKRPALCPTCAKGTPIFNNSAIALACPA
jgi:hypothetical protein